MKNAIVTGASSGMGREFVRQQNNLAEPAEGRPKERHGVIWRLFR